MLDASPSAHRPAPSGDWELSAWIGALLVLLALPTLAGFLQVPPGDLFTGILSDRDQDAWSYIAKMRQGWDGNWLFENRYTHEPHQPVWGVFLYYLGLGHLAHWTGVPLLVTYHVARLAGTGLFLVSLDRLLRLFWPERRRRRWAFLLVILAGGVGWVNELNAVWGDPRWWPGWLVPIDVLWTGMTTVGTLLLYSHYPWALWLIVESIRTSYLAQIQGRWPVAGALFAFFLALHHPYDIVPVMGTLSLWHLLRVRQDGWKTLLRLLLIGCSAAIPVVYYYWIFHQHPIMSQWAAQNHCLSPHVWVYVLGFGGRLLLAFLGLVPKWEPDRPWGLAACWLGINLPLLYFPVSWQRLMMFGLPLVLMIWGSRALFWLTDRWGGRAGLLLALALLSPTSLMLVQAGLNAPISLAPDEAALYGWLDQEPHSGRAVLADLPTSTRLVALSGQRVFVGHWSETPGYNRRLAILRQWYRSRDPVWLKEQRIGWVVWGPQEKKLAQHPPFDRPPDFVSGSYWAWRLP